MRLKKTVYLLVGLPGSGKSTWAKKRCAENAKAAYISRDEIRFSLLKDGEEYFAKEKEAFKIFISTIKKAMSDEIYEEIYIDATHLNEHSRQKVLDKLDLKNWDICLVNFTTPIEVCIKRNATRTGRAFVPEDVIRNMNGWRDVIQPMFKYDYYVIDVNEEGEIINEQSFCD
jgi:predicted kinase